MCGILLNLFRNDSAKICAKQFKELINNRGPNSYNEIENNIGNGWNSLTLGSVLWTQGGRTSLQPIRNNSGSFLLWNGDVYHGLPNSGEETCDSELVFAELEQYGVLSTVSKISGPYAIIYYDVINNELWFGRDAVGRHSLLWNVDSENLLLTSVCPRSVVVEEVPNCGIFKIDLSKPIVVYLHPWSHLSADRIDVTIRVPFLLGSSLSHASFISANHYAWYHREPQKHEIEFYNGFDKSSEATKIFHHLVLNPPLHQILKQMKHLMIQAVRRRIKTKPDYCSNCISSLMTCNHSKFAILFSGGLDSTILAAIASYVAPHDESIDLYNVAFDKFGTKNNGFLVPDRLNGYESLKELTILFPERKWNFVEINVRQEELQDLRRQHIADLIYPLKSILDDSLGCALWFAARGKGVINGQPYTSSARILLLGMGADEIFGGYSRHRKEFEKQGWTGLGLQLIEEVNNIGRRNLGRDNRVTTDHGRQPRLPFLDEDLLEFALSLPPWHRCCLMSNMTPGKGDKILLRCLAWDLGLRYCASLPKKALQFGSKIANPKEKGHNISQNLV
ncbi:asparagine synthetase domain-containing protein 1 isoform X2 [Rhodnius prolixus]|uniref:asparagine synthetase domain-containing protein 1 isoform X2 n=1 Tax=Rhodnius prolixus TaxID=13249 RepID=UPI003D18B35F